MGKTDHKTKCCDIKSFLFLAASLKYSRMRAREKMGQLNS